MTDANPRLLSGALRSWIEKLSVNRPLTLLPLIAVSGLALVSLAAGQSITEFGVPTADSFLSGITVGPDGALWFAEEDGNNIGRITTAGVVTEFAIPTAGCQPGAIAAGSDGALWFTEIDGSKIGRITTAGVITEFPLPNSDSTPPWIAAGPDGALWFTENDSNRIGRITTAGVITEFPLPTAGCVPGVIVAGPDGALWFTENNGNKIGRITTAGAITEFTVPTAASGPFAIAAGLDGALWFTEQLKNKIGRITTAGAITEFVIPTADSLPAGIAAGPDGALWFAEAMGNKIGRITPTGIITEVPVPTANSLASFITAGPDGALWFLESDANKVGRMTTGAGCNIDGTTLCLSGDRFKVRTHWATPDGRSGSGQAVQLTSDTGYFWFFGASNVEMVVKALNACGINQNFWVFAGGLTNVQVDLTVTDTFTGDVRTYRNPQDTPFQPIQDTAAFASCSSSLSPLPPNEDAERAGARAPVGTIARSAAANRLPLPEPSLRCAADAVTLCLSSGRFKVQTHWTTAEGGSGDGQAIALSPDTGYFWFFNSSNVEMIVKVLNACSFASRVWVFAGGLTNVQVDLTVTDTQTGTVKTYHNPQNTAFLPIQDTNAFATCP